MVADVAATDFASGEYVRVLRSRVWPRSSPNISLGTSLGGRDVVVENATLEETMLPLDV